jgi:hypothetical protein
MGQPDDFNCVFIPLFSETCIQNHMQKKFIIIIMQIAKTLIRKNKQRQNKDNRKQNKEHKTKNTGRTLLLTSNSG